VKTEDNIEMVIQKNGVRIELDRLTRLGEHKNDPSGSINSRNSMTR
jgi:hypothetical protein